MSLRQRTRRAVRAEIVDAAMHLFLDRGFEATTVEEIAEAAEISRRSYFRYFGSKDEVLVEALASTGLAIAGALAERPEGEAPWDSLRCALAPVVERASAGINAESLARLMLERPRLQQAKNATWLAEITTALEARLPDGQDRPLRAHALASAAIACLHTAQEQWLHPDEGRELGSLLTITMGTVHALGAEHYRDA